MAEGIDATQRRNPEYVDQPQHHPRHSRAGGKPAPPPPSSYRRRPVSCAREGAQTAWCKSVPGQAMTPKLKVTASPRGGVESNRKRTGSPQDDELDSAGSDGELAIPWRSLKHTGHAEMAGKAMFGSPSWLEAECWEVCARQAGRPAVEVTTAGVRAFIVPKRRKPREERKVKPYRGKGGRKVEARRPKGARA